MCAARWRKGRPSLKTPRASRSVDTANFWRRLRWGEIAEQGTDRITIEGVLKASGRRRLSCAAGSYRNGDFLVAAAISRGKNPRVTRSEGLWTRTAKLRDAGADIEVGGDWIGLDMHGGDRSG
ncbi:hypothetical protein KCP78_16165 [Salmonella enterica subsp. enterica]|nr:hypothetical protein KCP78_16165 [Salmonella enterica subsp. enterica]